MILTNPFVAVRSGLETAHIHPDASVAPAQRGQYRQAGRLHPWGCSDLTEELCPEGGKPLSLASKQRGRAEGGQILRVQRFDHHCKHSVSAKPRINALEVLQCSDEQSRAEQQYKRQSNLKAHQKLPHAQAGMGSRDLILSFFHGPLWIRPN